LVLNAGGSHYRLGVDIGGTFTDAVLTDDTSGAVWTAKVLTTESPDDGAVRAVADALSSAGADYRELVRLIHATTLASNTVLQRRGARVAVVTNAGFEDLLAIRREVRYDGWNLGAGFVAPIVPRELCFGVAGRTLVDGTEHAPVDRAELVELAGRLGVLGVESVAVCLLHSYANSTHEEDVAAVLSDELGPTVPVSRSSAVCPEVREYERMSTTVINAYLQPTIERYQARLQSSLAERGYPGRIYVMISSGGVATTDVTSQFPVRLIESGPVAGVLAAAQYARAVGESTLVALDIGGTTAKACLIRDGQPERGHGVEVARVNRYVAGSGLPVQVPAVDLIEVGAGGGSIARANALRFLEVGPQSAESRPGPACYGLGGQEATVTDANLVLGLLDAKRFANGTISLDIDAAERAIDRLGARLGMSMTDCASAILAVVNENMADAVRVHLAEKGQDPAETTLLASGGGGPLHAVAVCRKLGIRRVIVPPRAGVLSAVGLLVAAPAVDFTRTMVTRLDRSGDWDQINRGLRDIEDQARAVLAQAGVPAADIAIERWVTARWVGQTHELEIPVSDGLLGVHSGPELMSAYDAVCRRIYGASLRPTVLELLTWRTGARAPARTAAATSPEPTNGSPTIGNREIRLPGRAPQRAVVYDRYALPIGFEGAGPAVIEEAESTCVIGDQDSFRRDEHGNLIVKVGSQ
jgi:N-methylhydantoinase A